MRPRFGDDLTGADLLAWHQDVGYKHWFNSENNTEAVPEPVSGPFIFFASALLPLHRYGHQAVRKKTADYLKGSRAGGVKGFPSDRALECQACPDRRRSLVIA
jgi:hypothetical protein